jgi:hypothetical protein
LEPLVICGGRKNCFDGCGLYLEPALKKCGLYLEPALKECGLYPQAA